MAMVKFTKGTLANLGNVEKVAGQVLITTDERAMYLDLSSTQRIRIGDFQEYANWAAIQAIPAANLSTTALYYAAAENILAKYTGSGWTQINAQKDLAALGGVSKAEYDGKVKDLGDAINGKVDKVTGKSLVDDAEITKLAGVSAGANKVESAGNGKIKIDGVETTVYTHPDKHTIADVDGLQDALDGKQAKGDYAAEVHKHVVADITDFDSSVKAYGYATKDEAKAMADGKDTAIAAAKKAGDDAAAALETYKGTNDVAVQQAQATADAKVASVTAADASVTVAGTATAPTVAVKLDPSADNAIKMSDAGLKVEIGAAPEYTIVKAADSGDYAAVYTLMKDGVQAGAAINIPKDMVVKSGSVNADGDIVLVLNDEASTEIVIDAASLIEYVTSGSSAGDMVVITVSDDHKVTAAITDGTITAAKLTTELQTAIGKAHSHENAAVLAGITEQNITDWNDAVAKEHEHGNKALLDTYTQTDVNLADAVAKKHKHANAEELAKIAVGDKAKWDGAATDAAAIKADYLKGADKTELEGKITAAQVAAEKVANDNNTAMDTRVKVLEAIDHDAYKDYADKAETDAIASAKEYTDSALEWGSF